jgi:hypothetical protein
MNQEPVSKPNSKFDNIVQEYTKIISNTLRSSTVRCYKNSLKIFITFLNSNYPEIKRLSDIKPEKCVKTLFFGS